ncbi:MAG: polyprenyl synthetase family protein [Gemmatimonadota bacterium]
MLEATSVALDAVRDPIRDRLRLVEDELQAMVPADFEAVDEVGAYLLSARGKLFRPTILLLSNEIDGTPSSAAVKLGAIVELMHVATLVHDDAVDHSVRRRGMPTVNARWTHQVAIIMGDYLYSRALVEISSLAEVEMIQILARTSNRMTIGEMRQLISYDALGYSRRDYYLLCEYKTASLMAAASELGALAGAPAYRRTLRSFGFHLGMAFQVTDDLLDYTSPASITGKPGGQDLREHKVTLPLISALPEMTAGERNLVERLFADPLPSEAMVSEVIEAVQRGGGLAAARSEAAVFAERARQSLEALPSGPALDALRIAVDYVVERER